MIEAARAKTLKQNRHLESCAECQVAVRMLGLFPVQGLSPLPDAPPILVERAAGLAETATFLDNIKTVMLSLTFDSWDEPQLVGVRDQSTVSDRRFRFEAESIRLDVRAERGASRWAFVAQVTGPHLRPSQVILVAGRQEVQADSSGLFHWTSTRPPDAVKIRFDELIIVTPRLSWKSP